MNSTDLVELHWELTQRWNLPPVDATPLQRDHLREALATRVAHMLQYEYQRLLSAMYLLDVSEERFNAAQRAGGVEEASRQLADVILEREEEKFVSRRKYQRGRSIDATFEEAEGEES